MGEIEMEFGPSSEGPGTRDQGLGTLGARTKDPGLWSLVPNYVPRMRAKAKARAAVALAFPPVRQSGNAADGRGG
jgi:hypothetical protein